MPNNHERIVICGLDDYRALVERAMNLERELANLKHQMEIDNLKAKLEEAERRERDTYCKNLALTDHNKKLTEEIEAYKLAKEAEKVF